MKNGLIVDNNGTKEWYLNNELHRENGPAIEYAYGTKEWYVHGNLHREDGPAVEWRDGSKEWYIHGKKINYQFTSLKDLYDNHPEELI